MHSQDDIDTRLFLRHIGWSTTTLSVMKHPVEDCLEKHWERLYNFALSKSWYHKQDAEDILSESIAKALIKWDSVKPSKLLSWIFKIIQNTSIDYARKKRSVSELSDANTRYDWEDPSWSRQQLESILYSLGIRDRQLLTLSYIEEKTNSEIAQLLGIKVPQVAVQLTRARKRGKLTAQQLYGPY
jgi:RNA polymerase sigma factor (sigma-70 family)